MAIVESTKKPNRRQRFVRLIIFGLVMLIVVLYCGGISLYMVGITVPVRREIRETPADWGYPGYEEVALVGGDDLTLQGWYIPPQNGAAILLIHGYSADRTKVEPIARMLLNAGYGTLMMDMRGHGESDGKRSAGWRDMPDVIAMIDFLAAKPDVEHIGVWGFSYGGYMAITAGAELTHIEAVVADSPGVMVAQDYEGLRTSPLMEIPYYHSIFLDSIFSVWVNTPKPASIIASLPQLAPRPVMLIVGTRNTQELRINRAFHELASDPKTTWEVEGAGHGSTWVAESTTYERRLIDFYDTAFFR